MPLTGPVSATNLPVMELSDLDQGERTALIGLMKLVVLSDTEVSDDELDHIETLVDAFGEGEYQRTLDALDTDASRCGSGNSCAASPVRMRAT